MKIIILGAGQVGGTLAENLVGEKNEITVIDSDPVTLRALQDRLDLQVVNGVGSHPDVLRKAGAEDADMIIAVTNSDESNMLACQVAYSLFKTPTKIARVRSEQYIIYQEQLYKQQDIPVDHIIAPEQLVTKAIKRLIDYPGALQVVEFADGKASLVAVKAYYASAFAWICNLIMRYTQHHNHFFLLFSIFFLNFDLVKFYLFRINCINTTILYYTILNLYYIIVYFIS